MLGNGRLTSLITGLGGGGLRWRGLDLTRYEPDATLDEEGIWFFLRDEESREVWRATSADGRTTYAMDRLSFTYATAESRRASTSRSPQRMTSSCA